VRRLPSPERSLTPAERARLHQGLQLATSTFGNISTYLLLGDITEQRVDAIVNSAKTTARMSGSIGGALRSAGGREIERQAQTHAPIPLGRVVVTGAGKLPAKAILHAAVLDDRLKAADLPTVEATIRKILDVCRQRQLRSVALPLLGTGTSKLGRARVLRTLLRVLQEEAFQIPHPLEILIIVTDEAAPETLKAFLNFQSMEEEWQEVERVANSYLQDLTASTP
jgi:O-acetyl-ADP-ribose deacetylase (regulator of RNase III)